jgi:hypothetical protein
MENGYRVKLQKVERPTNRSYYINFPVALAEALGMEKGEEFEWLIEDKNTLVFTRVVPKALRAYPEIEKITSWSIRLLRCRQRCSAVVFPAFGTCGLCGTLLDVVSPSSSRTCIRKNGSDGAPRLPRNRFSSRIDTPPVRLSRKPT